MGKCSQLGFIGVYSTIVFSGVIQASPQHEGLQNQIQNFSGASDDCFSMFDYFVNKFGKTYISLSERSYRRTVFCDNARNVSAMNIGRNDDLEFGINIFSDMSPSEFASLYLTPIVMDTTLSLGDLTSATTSAKVLTSYPSSYNFPCQPGVKNQGQCGSCYVFAAVHALEGAYYKRFGVCLSLSEEQVMDCGESFGCSGGYPREVIRWAGKQASDRGLCESRAYPYIGTPTHCRLCDEPRRFSIAHIWFTDSASTLRSMIYEDGPTTIAFWVEHQFQSYQSGVYRCVSATSSINHAVAAVGYGPGYFKMRNSWGTHWGMAGYFHLADYSCNMLKQTYHTNAVSLDSSTSVEIDFARGGGSRAVVV